MKLTGDRYVRGLLVFCCAVLLALTAYRLFLWRAGTPLAERQAPVSRPNNHPAAEPTTAPAKAERFPVARVVDGDTLVLANGETVRLIGVDTPETLHPEIPVQRFGQEATEFTRRMVEGLRVKLEFGPERKDGYGRTLAYVFVDGTLLNEEIIRRGYGYAMTRFPHARQAQFIEAECEARAKQYGLWNYSLADGRVTNLLHRYESLDPEGKKQLEKVWDELLKKYPSPRRTEKRNEP